jgi:hypothetical protein
MGIVRGSLRASDSDRERTAERLKAAAVEGRLLAHELEDRLALVLRARTYGELDAVVADLPGRRVARQARTYVMTAAVVAAAVAVIAVIALVVTLVVTGVAIWMFWVALGWWFFGRRRHACRPRHSGWELRTVNRRGAL